MCLWQIRRQAVEQSDDRASVKQMDPETCVRPSKSVGGNDRGRVIQWGDAVCSGPLLLGDTVGDTLGVMHPSVV